MDPERLQETLRATFLAELEEHVRSLTADLLALERAAGDPERTELLQRLFRTVHSVKGSSRAASVELIEAAAGRMEQVLAAARDDAGAGAAAVDLLLEAVDAIEEAGQRLRERRELAGAPLEGVVSRLGGPGAPARPPPAAAPPPAPAAVPVAPGPLSSVRLGTDRLDRLQALEAELRAARHAGDGLGAAVEAVREAARRWAVAAEPGRPRREGAGHGRALRRPAAAAADHAGLRAVEGELDRLLAAIGEARRRVDHAAEPLADALRSIRMVPFSDACAGLERAARDVARAAGREVALELRGGEVALDRAVAEALRAPLVHLVRNAADHGIEPPAERTARGKGPRGRIAISAALRGGTIEIAVEDDGRGLDLAAIRARARAGGLPDEGDPAALARLVFLPGFTTARRVTEVSGRGVGLDAVRAGVEALQGSVDVESRAGGGTRFVLDVPLTLASLRALVVSAGGEALALPASHVRRMIAVDPHDVVALGGRDTVLVDGAPVALARLSDVLGLAAGEARRRGPVPAVLVAGGGRHAALAVDALLSEQELQVRGLGARVRRLRHLAGTAILPDGTLAVILQVPEVVATALGRAAGPTFPAAAPARRRRRIVLVDDSPTTRTLERSILESAGYAVATAADGEEAWALLAREGADALVADVEMPRLDGFALTEAVRSSPDLRALPVVLVTARESEADRARGLGAGANAYLVKSAFDQRSLLETLEQLLG